MVYDLQLLPVQLHCYVAQVRNRGLKTASVAASHLYVRALSLLDPQIGCEP